ncbi:MAG: hypothetical protein GF311_28220 [Candidatus Lokiarchaeota archaeon]|nr:hypothetical protein [Candidatus Lokiarchaeota archaeon]
MAILEVYETGDDALGIHFDFDIASFGLFQPGNIKFRTTTFNVPGITLGTYTIDFKGQHFEKPNYNDDTSKEFSFTLRLDKQYEVYRKFAFWLYSIKNISTGANSVDKPVVGPSKLRTPEITVVATDGNAPNPTVFQTWRFTQCFPKSISDVSFDNTGTDPITLDITMSYLTLNTDLTA